MDLIGSYTWNIMDILMDNWDFIGNIMGIHWEYNRNVNGHIMNGLGYIYIYTHNVNLTAINGGLRVKILDIFNQSLPLPKMLPWTPWPFYFDHLPIRNGDFL
jgi:hypothetical protein